MKSGGISAWIGRLAGAGRPLAVQTFDQAGDDAKGVLQLWPFSADRAELDRDGDVFAEPWGDLPFIDPALEAACVDCALRHAVMMAARRLAGDSLRPLICERPTGARPNAQGGAA